MHIEDETELLATVTKIERELQRLLAAATTRPQAATLQRIVVLARYLKEHVGMLGDGTAAPRAQRKRRRVAQ